eukprot:TRINITY_DN2854_c2_g1_i3.p1 TRINITY_DN2854_c2_g1~~TRINITY_DN2854_c2_g1_i3.p1  ORF type:complete len:460 (+),score=96.98 TRINITY_DN2854_c2_g1_i3:1307-2686(+)
MPLSLQADEPMLLQFTLPDVTGPQTMTFLVTGTAVHLLVISGSKSADRLAYSTTSNQTLSLLLFPDTWYVAVVSETTTAASLTITNPLWCSASEIRSKPAGLITMSAQLQSLPYCDYSIGSNSTVSVMVQPTTTSFAPGGNVRLQSDSGAVYAQWDFNQQQQQQQQNVFTGAVIAFGNPLHVHGTNLSAISMFEANYVQLNGTAWFTVPESMYKSQRSFQLAVAAPPPPQGLQTPENALVVQLLIAGPLAAAYVAYGEPAQTSFTDQFWFTRNAAGVAVINATTSQSMTANGGVWYYQLVTQSVDPVMIMVQYMYALPDPGPPFVFDIFLLVVVDAAIIGAMCLVAVAMLIKLMRTPGASTLHRSLCVAVIAATLLTAVSPATVGFIYVMVACSRAIWTSAVVLLIRISVDPDSVRWQRSPVLRVMYGVVLFVVSFVYGLFGAPFGWFNVRYCLAVWRW